MIERSGNGVTVSPETIFTAPVDGLYLVWVTGGVGVPNGNVAPAYPLGEFGVQVIVNGALDHSDNSAPFAFSSTTAVAAPSFEAASPIIFRKGGTLSWQTYAQGGASNSPAYSLSVRALLCSGSDLAVE